MTLLLGIDTGTTKSACVIIDKESRELLACVSRAHGAGLGDGLQDAEKHLSVIKELLAELPAELMQQVSAVGVTGQMHGVVLWSQKKVSELYSWQSRIPEDSLAKFRMSVPGLCHGFGVSTLAYLAAENALDGYTCAATIHDFLVWHLTGGTTTPVMDAADAASWGCFDLEKGCFDMNGWRALAIPEHLCPEVVPMGSCAGRTVPGWNIPAGIPVMAATGDNQASVAAAAGVPEEEIYLTLGTGAQLSVVIPESVPGVECRPYSGNRFLAVAAPLCGGAAWAWLVRHVKEWQQLLGMPDMPESQIYDIIDHAALEEFDAPDLPEIIPSFLGERSAPDLRGSISGLTLENYTPGKIAAALARGIISNLRSTLPESLQKNRKKLLVSGNAVRRTLVLQKACTAIFGLTPEIPESREEAACGAAVMSGHLTESRV